MGPLLLEHSPLTGSFSKQLLTSVFILASVNFTGGGGAGDGDGGGSDIQPTLNPSPVIRAIIHPRMKHIKYFNQSSIYIIGNKK